MIVLLILFIGPVLAVGYLKWSHSEPQKANQIIWPLTFLTVIGVGILSAYSFGDFFPGLGCFISLAAPIGAVLTAGFVRWWLRKQAADIPKIPRILANWLIPFLLVCIPIIAFSYQRGCEAVNRRQAQPLIRALESAEIPSDLVAQTQLDFLVPNYLAEIPTPICRQTNESEYTFETWSLYPCENGVLLMVPMLGSDSVQTYDLSTGKWSVGSAFDGYCQ